MNKVLKKIHGKQYLEAHGLCLEMIRRDVNDPHPYHALGLIAFEHRNFSKALELYARAADLDPDCAQYWAAKAQVLSVLGRQNEAREAAETASELPVSDPITADTLAVVFSRAGFHERAIPFFHQAISLNPQPANFHYNLGASLQFAGRFEDAKAAYLATLERDSGFFKAFTGLVGLEKQTADDNKLDLLLSLFDRHCTDGDACLHIGHAIAKTYEDLGDFEQSFLWLGRAKEKHAKQFPVNLADQKALFQAAKAPLIPETSSTTTRSQAAPIFVVGLPRTGTTLVDRILSSHPDVVAAGELNVFAALVKAAVKTSENTVLDAQTLLAATATDFGEIGEQYVASTKVLARGATRFTDKMPLNFFYAGMIHRALPNARIIALRRGAMDSCLSNYRQLFSTQFSYYNYTFDLDSTAQFYRGFDDLMAHWRAVLPPDRFTEVHYEDIVFDQENQTRRLLEFCDLDWNEACLRFHENAMPVSTASSVQVRQPLYAGSIGRWKRYGDCLDGLQQALGDLAE